MMPSDKKRINLTVPDDVYERLQEYKKEASISNDASACLQLIVLQLKAQKNIRLMQNLLEQKSLEQLQQMSDEGLSFLKENL